MTTKSFFTLCLCLFISRLAHANEVQNKKLYEELKKAGAPSYKKQNMEKVYLFHLFCHIVPEKDDTKTICEAYKTFQKTSKNKISINKAKSENLFQTLSDLPLIKGDSGISSEFMSCEKNNIAKKDYYSCQAAMPIGEEK